MHRIVVAGLGDTGLLAAIHLARRRELDVVGISAKPGLLSGQSLGRRLARPASWQEEFRRPFSRYRGLDGTRTVHASLTGVDLARREVHVRSADGAAAREPYDSLVVATGVTSGFWRRPELQDDAAVDADLDRAHRRVAAASSVAVVGGGPSAIGAAAQIAETFPWTRVDLWFPRDRALLQHHPAVWDTAHRLLARLGVGLHPGHRAALPAGPDGLTTGPVTFTTGQPPAAADLVVWAVGGAVPNTGWLPRDLLDADGFVRTDPFLRVPGAPGVWAVGDAAATDPLRSTARNNGSTLLARNLAAVRRGRAPRAYRPPRHRWGDVLGGPLAEGLHVFAPGGRHVRIPTRLQAVIQRVVVERGTWRGVRPIPPEG